MAEVDISILASSLETGGRGEVTVEDSALDSSGTMTLQTGDEGRTEVRENSGLHAAGTITIISGRAGKTVAHDNRIVGEESSHILSSGRTSVQENDFTGSGSVSIEGPRCRARNNIPAVECTRETLSAAGWPSLQYPERSPGSRNWSAGRGYIAREPEDQRCGGRGPAAAAANPVASTRSPRSVIQIDSGTAFCAVASMSRRDTRRRVRRHGETGLNRSAIAG